MLPPRASHSVECSRTPPLVNRDHVQNPYSKREEHCHGRDHVASASHDRVSAAGPIFANDSSMAHFALRIADGSVCCNAAQPQVSHPMARTPRCRNTIHQRPFGCIARAGHLGSQRERRVFPRLSCPRLRGRRSRQPPTRSSTGPFPASLPPCSLAVASELRPERSSSWRSSNVSPPSGVLPTVGHPCAYSLRNSSTSSRSRSNFSPATIQLRHGLMIRYPPLLSA